MDRKDEVFFGGGSEAATVGQVESRLEDLKRLVLPKAP